MKQKKELLFEPMANGDMIYWDNTSSFVKFNPGFLDLLVLLDAIG